MKLLNAMFRRFIQTGTVEIVDVSGQVHMHTGTPGRKVRIRLHDEKLYKSLVLNPELKLGEAYMDGTLTFEEGGIRDLLELYMDNRANLRSQPFQKAVRKGAKRLKKLFQGNTLKRSRENVAHHYDLSNDLYRLFLDEGMNYSCAYYRSPDDSLDVAQENKLRHIASKMNIQPGDRVLDIGCGWGGMSLYLAQNFDVEVLGITLSTEQLELARTRAKEAGLEGKVRFELQDYRTLDDRFDRIVSIGMFEHVGLQYFEAYFSKIRDLLTEDGVAVVHSIGRKGGPGSTGAWIRKYIFPGGYSPALSETMGPVERAGLWITDIEIWRLHYAETLLEWSKRFAANWDTIAAMYDQRFCRMFEFYLIISELSFRAGKHMNFQLQLTRSRDALPLQRDYMYEVEQGLVAPKVRKKATKSNP